MHTESMDTSPRKLRFFQKRRWRYSLLSLLVLLLVALIARRHIGNLLANQLNQRLAAAGLHVSWKSANLVTGPGVKVTDLALYRDATRNECLVQLENLTARKGKNGWASVEVQVDSADLKLGHGEDETTFKNVVVDLQVESGKVILHQCQAILQGLRIEATANFIPPASSPGTPQHPSPSPLADLDLSWLGSLKQWVAFIPRQQEPILKINYQSRDANAADLHVSLDGQQFGWHGQEWDAVQVSIKTAITTPTQPVEIESLHIGHAGKAADVKGSYHPTSGQLTIQQLSSSLDLFAMARAFTADQGAALASLTSNGDWQVQASGVLGLKETADNKLQGALSLTGACGYAAEKTRIELNNPQCQFSFVQSTVSIHDFKAGLWGGNLHLPLTHIELPAASDAAPRFDSTVTLAGAKMAKVMSSFGTTNSQPGHLDLDWNGGGGFDLHSIQGGGSLAIRDAEFFRIPLLGPLHLVFDQISPGFGRDVASDLTCQHSLKDGILSIRRLHLDSTLTRINANGDINIAENHAYLTAEAKLQGLVGKATALLSSMLEVEGSGPTSDMKWRLKNFPNGKMITGAAKALGDTGGAVIQGTGQAIKSTGKSVKGLLKVPRKLFGK